MKKLIEPPSISFSIRFSLPYLGGRESFFFYILNTKNILQRSNNKYSPLRI
ncbi:hypothetical protein HMPREF9071_1783 [Capnocytophaga sp. oral taxon 338 str. F0234]|nr:hypothetical protein HMPREF9071_1783 [Capnocytophaga sp. oral taxon 338 str. F0234]